MNPEDSSTSRGLREKLREQESMLAYAHIIARDREGLITFWSATDEELYGWSASEALGQNSDELLGTEFPEPKEELERRVHATGRWEGEIVHHSRDGRRLILSTTWVSHREEGGELAAIIEINCNITKQKIAERELRARERDFRTFFELNGVGNVLTDFETGRFLKVNQTFLDLTGYSEEELQHLSGTDLTHPDDREREATGWSAAQAQGAPHHTIEKRYVRKDGRVSWVSITSTIIRDDAGSPLYSAGVVIDISSRHEAMVGLAKSRQELEARFAERTAALHHVNETFETLIDASPAAVIALDSSRRVEIWNPEAEHLFGLREEETVGRRFLDLPLKWSSSETLDALLEMPGHEHANLHLEASNGHSLEVGVWSAPYSGHAGPVPGRVLLILDETEKRFLEHALLAAGEREQRRIGEELHEGLCQQLLGAAFGAQALFKELDRAASPSAEQAGDLARLINDSVLHARNLARGINPVEIDPAGLMSALQELAERLPDAAHIELRCEKPVLVRSTEVALHVFRIAHEAITNALRHAQASRILLRLTEEAGGNVTLQVSDNGSRGDETTARDAGVGLEIMKYRAQAIRGSLDIETISSGGTTVTCTFPNE
ncbi:MAG TPA: PAS domain S-box protein [Chthoniobacterales bacterium]|nr:PAS domain S-box protein [Chthoniobacterales bacterium]